MAKGGRYYRESRKEKGARCEIPTPSWDSFMNEARKGCLWNEFNGYCTIQICT